MIEVEKKFILDKESEKRLLDGAEFLVEKVFTDIYYDTENFDLTKDDKWLRQRAGKWELKICLDKNLERKVDIYDEIEDENEIRKILNIPASENMEKDLGKLGYVKFCVCKTTRKKYKSGAFGIDIDYVAYGDFNYELAEIELMVEDERETQYALKKIVELAEFVGLKTGYVRGKVAIYLIEKKPEHFQALVKAGVLRGLEK